MFDRFLDKHLVYTRFDRGYVLDFEKEKGLDLAFNIMFEDQRYFSFDFTS